jgi:tRNA G18 (ribose-2'-O)-methylase SpoU
VDSLNVSVATGVILHAMLTSARRAPAVAEE